MALSILCITDGSTRIDLVGTVAGFHLLEWRPGVPDIRSVVADSPFLDGSRLVSRLHTNATETFTLALAGQTRDEVVTDLQDLRRLLQKASNYWLNMANSTPVWIEAQDSCEASKRYAFIYDWRLTGESNPFGTSGGLVSDELTLIVERGEWQDTQPLTDRDIRISMQQVFNGVTYGQEETVASGALFCANKHNQANLTNVMYYDASVPAYGPNTIGAAKPVNLFPAIPAVGDILYVGCDVTVANSGPFCSVIFNIGTAATNITTVVWEYWNGAWTAFGVNDIRDLTYTAAPWDLTGTRSVVFTQKADWITRNLGGVVGYWIRCTITVVGANPTPPTQATRDVYSAVWPCFNVAASQNTGDLPALLRETILNRSDSVAGHPLGPSIYGFSRVLIGTRSASRGSNYTPYINMADNQNPAGVTIVPDPFYPVATNVIMPTGRCYPYAPAGAGSATMAVYMTGALSAEYYGKYRCFFRALWGVAPTANLLSIKLTFCAWSAVGGASTPIPFYTTPTVYNQVNVINNTETFDFGYVTIPPSEYLTEQYQLYIKIDYTWTGAATFYPTDLILMPIDEGAWEFFDMSNKDPSSSVAKYQGEWRYLLIDGARTRRQNIRAKVSLYGTNYTLTDYTVVANSAFCIPANTEMRFWHFTQTYPKPGALPAGLWSSYFGVTNTHTLKAVNRYYGSRGER